MLKNKSLLTSGKPSSYHVFVDISVVLTHIKGIARSRVHQVSISEYQNPKESDGMSTLTYEWRNKSS